MLLNYYSISKEIFSFTIYKFCLWQFSWFILSSYKNYVCLQFHFSLFVFRIYYMLFHNAITKPKKKTTTKKDIFNNNICNNYTFWEFYLGQFSWLISACSILLYRISRYYISIWEKHTEYKIKSSLLPETLDVLRLSVLPLVSNWSGANWPVKIQSTGLGNIDTRWNSLAEFSPLFQFLRSTDNAGLCRARSSVLPFLRCACVTYVTGGPATRSTANGQRHESLGFHCFSIDHHRDSVSCSFCRPHPAKPPHSGPILIIGDARRRWN